MDGSIEFAFTETIKYASKRACEPPWRLHIGNLWKLHFMTDSKV